MRRDISWEIKDIKLAIDMSQQIDYPDRNRLFMIFYYIMRDGHLKSQIQTARIKVASEPWVLYKNSQPDLKATELFNKTWFNKLIEHIVDQEWEGYRLIELNDINPQEVTVGRINKIPGEYVSIDKQWILLEATINGPYIEYGDLMNELDLLQFGTTDNLGSLLECAYNILWKYYARSDWSRASEKVGMPILVLAADTTDDKELDDYENRAANMASDGYDRAKEDVPTLLERKSDRMHDVYLDNVKLCNEEVSKIINGNTATTDQKAFVGSSQVQERTMDDFTNARLQMIVNNMNDVVIPYLKAKGFPIDHTFDYPLLRRNRERRITGMPLATDPKPADTPPSPEGASTEAT